MKSILKKMVSYYPASNVALLCIGGVVALIQASLLIAQQRYLPQKMFRLAAETLVDSLNTWLIICLVLFFILLMLSYCVRSFFRRRTGRRSEKTAKAFGIIILLLGIACTCWLLPALFPVLLPLETSWRIALFFPVVLGALTQGLRIIRQAPTEHVRAPKRMRALAPLIVYCICIGIVNAAILLDRNNTPTGNPNIILIVIDCLRADSLGCYGMSPSTSPAIDRLAKQGVIFTRAYANAPWTKPSVASLFTSLHPRIHGAYNPYGLFSNKYLTIAEVLKNNYYQTFLLNGGNHYCDKRYNFHQGFDYTFFEIKRNAALLTDEVISTLEKRDQRPFFAYVHYMDAHVPYEHNKYTDMFVSGIDPSPAVPSLSDWNIVANLRAAATGNSLTENDKRYIKGLYHSQIRYIDDSIDKITTYLQHNGLLDQTIVILTSDHGEEFFEHGNFEHGHTVYNELVHVPLVMSFGPLEHRIVDDNVQLIDVMPTILDLADSDIAVEQCRGQSLFNTITKGIPTPDVTIQGSGTLYGDEKHYAVYKNQKVLLNTGETDNKHTIKGRPHTRSFEYYNLLNDPAELEPVTEHFTFSGLKQSLEQHINESSSAGTPTDAPLDKEHLKDLQSLGYIQ